MKLGQWNILRIDRIKEVGAYLTDGKGIENIPGSKSRDENAAPTAQVDVLLPKKQIPEGLEVGDNIQVFVYRDSADRLISTVHEPLITVGEVKKLKVKSSNDIGAFVECGLERDLFLPFREQTVAVKPGKSYLVKMYVDKSGRLAVSMKISSELKPNTEYKRGDHVTGTVYNVKKDFGAFVAIDDKYAGLIHTSEIFDSLYVGDTVSCRVVKVREDGKTDLAMRDEIPTQMIKDADMVYDIIMSYNGHLPFTDKADAEVIKREFGISKNAFKRAVGHLLKDKKIIITSSGIDVV